MKNIRIEKKFGKYTVKIMGSTILITDDWFSNYGTIYDHVKTGDIDYLGRQKYPFGFDSEIQRKDITKWLTKKILMLNDNK